MNDWF